MKLVGKVALVTGASKRIGREIALTLAERGVSLILHYRKSRREAENLCEEIRDRGSEAVLIQADFGHSRRPLQARIRRFVREACRKAGRIDILVNNASVFYPTPFEQITEKAWDDFFTVNLKAPFFLSREIGLGMVRRKAGKIVNLVDASAFRPHPKYLPYALSKVGLAAATEGLAKALAPRVQVLSIAPGPILPARGSTHRQNDIIARKTLLKRFGHPRDIARTVRFFVEDTDYITGAVLPVDGGAFIA